MNQLDEHELDVWHDIRGDYINYLKVGVKECEVSERIIKNNSDLFHSEYSDICWLSLASVEWDYGRLDDDVKKKALEIIQSGDCNGIKNKIKEKPDNPQPNPKKVGKIKLMTPLWDIGDIVEYRIDHPESKWDGKIIYLHVVGIDYTNIGTLPRDEFVHRFSIFKIYNLISNGNESQEDIIKLNYLPDIDIFTRQMVDARFIADYSSERDRKRILSSGRIIGNNKNGTSLNESICGACFFGFDNSDMSFLCADIDRAYNSGLLNIRS